MRVLLFLSLFITLILASKDEASKQQHAKHYSSMCDSKDDDSDRHHTQEQNEENLGAEELAEANMHFSLDMYKHVSILTPAKKNVFFSPLSIAMSLSMLSLGAKSSTHKQLLRGLKIHHKQIQGEQIHKGYEQLLNTLTKPKKNLQLSIGNAIFLNSKLKVVSSFEDQAKQYYNAQVVATNFDNPNKAVKQVNDFVKDKTHGEITEMVNTFDKDTDMVLLNYVLLQAKWELSFNPQLTQIGNFSLDSCKQVQVHMMQNIALYKTYRDKDFKCEVLQLPYKDNAYLLLVVPEMETMQDVEAALSLTLIKKWKNSLANSFVRLRVPKVSLHTLLKLEQPLCEMGMGDLFNEKANFCGITSQTKVQISNAIHKSVLNIDENGTEAGGVTDIQIVPTALFPSFDVDRPFIAIVCSAETDSILFMGRIMDPTQK
ncbi:serine protease inhibitor A6-like [Discoglossus pictus]